MRERERGDIFQTARHNRRDRNNNNNNSNNNNNNNNYNNNTIRPLTKKLIKWTSFK